jgi:hypothetical protein
MKAKYDLNGKDSTMLENYVMSFVQISSIQNYLVFQKTQLANGAEIMQDKKVKLVSDLVTENTLKIM